jgi:glycosyltransferase involved in cell wall biosynthesis
MAAVNLPPQIPVAIFMTRFQPGGTERQMTELIRRLDPSRFRVHVACFHKDGAWLDRVTSRAASVVEFPIHGFARPATVRQLLCFARWCRRERIAVVQTCDLYANTFGLPGAVMAGVPVRIGSRRELNPDKSPSQILLQRQAYRCATKIVANSPAAACVLRQEGIATGSIAVIANGIDASWFEAREAGRPLRTVITVANLRPEKNHETVIAAAAALAPTHPHVRFQIVGDGPRRQELESLVRARGLRERIEFLGHREDVPALLAAADVFVLASRSEAFPNSAIEAMAAGLPVVTSAVGGLLDLIENGRTGVLIAPADPDALTVALRDLLNDPVKAYALGAAARREVLNRYSFDRMVAAVEHLYLGGLDRGELAATARRPEAAGI